MEYSDFRDILNKTLLGGERVQLFERMAKNPERFVGLFRPSISRQKLLQNILQNREIRFGDVMERVFDKWLAEYGYEMLDPQITSELRCDLYFLAPDKHAYLVEMKMRDDHDSTKRRGQWNNFELKVKILHREYGSELTAIFYFVDPALSKNRNFYSANCEELRRDLQLDTILLWYGSQLFEHLTKAEDWDLLLDFLYEWKRELTETEMLNMESTDALKELSSLDIQVWERIANTKAFWDESFIRTLFPSGNGLRQIASEIESRRPSLVTTTLRQRIKDLYGVA
ncbi:hypothetical protein ES707_04503 [subsurface metagenome]